MLADYKYSRFNARHFKEGITCVIFKTKYDDFQILSNLVTLSLNDGFNISKTNIVKINYPNVLNFILLTIIVTFTTSRRALGPAIIISFNQHMKAY